MTEDDAIQVSADNLRADFLNADSNWSRWKIFNRALGWAVTASENADAARRAVQEREAFHAELMRTYTEANPPKVTLNVDAAGLAQGRKLFCGGGIIRPRTPPPLAGETGAEAVVPAQDSTAKKALQNVVWQMRQGEDE